MKRYGVTFAALALLALPLMAGAQPTTIPPQANWTAYPPAQGAVDATRLLELLVKKEVITPQEAAQLTQPQAAMPARPSRESAWEPVISVQTLP